MATIDVIKQSIRTNTPVQFLYSSKKSETLKGEEAPPHMRTVQPVVLGKKLTKNGIKTYFRGYLLGHYSYSKNRIFGGDTDANTKNEYWRLYDLSKVQNPKIKKQYPFRFSPSKHPEYNPKDKWMDTIIFSMAKESISDLTVLSERKEYEILSESIVRVILEQLKSSVDYEIYSTSENEECGYMENNRLFINSIWVEQESTEDVVAGIKSLLSA